MTIVPEGELATIGRGHCGACANPFTRCADTDCPCHRAGTPLWQAGHRIARLLVPFIRPRRFA